jgi:hypothetical protein
MDPTVAVNFPLADPTLIEKLAGTVIALFELDVDTVSPPVGAAALSVTVQLDVPGAFTGEGEHETAVGVTACGCGIVTVPLDPVDGILLPLASVETVPVSDNCVDVSVVFDAMVTVACATTPFAITVVLRPNAMQVRLPLTGEQETLLPAAVAADPATTEMLDMSVEE